MFGRKRHTTLSDQIETIIGKNTSVKGVLTTIGGNLWVTQKIRTARNRGFLKFVYNLPEIPEWQPGDIYMHPTIANHMRLNQQMNLQFSVAEINQNFDPTAQNICQAS